MDTVQPDLLREKDKMLIHEQPKPNWKSQRFLNPYDVRES